MEKRQKIYWELEKVLYENYADVWLYYPMYATAWSKRILGFEIERAKAGDTYYRKSHPSWFKDGMSTARK